MTNSRIASARFFSRAIPCRSSAMLTLAARLLNRRRESSNHAKRLFSFRKHAIPVIHYHNFISNIMCPEPMHFIIPMSTRVSVYGSTIGMLLPSPRNYYNTVDIWLRIIRITASSPCFHANALLTFVLFRLTLQILYLFLQVVSQIQLAKPVLILWLKVFQILNNLLDPFNLSEIIFFFSTSWLPDTSKAVLLTMDREKIVFAAGLSDGIAHNLVTSIPELVLRHWSSLKRYD